MIDEILPDDLFSMEAGSVNLPPFESFPTLTFENLVLRKMTGDDVPLLLDIMAYDKPKQAKNLAKAIEIYERNEQDYAQGQAVSWLIVDKKTSELLGTCGYYRGFGAATGELGFVLLPQYEGKGIMRKALRPVIAFGLEKLNLQRITAITRTTNKRALKLLHALDFVEIADLEDNQIAYEYFG